MGNKKNIIYLILGLGLGIIITNILHSAYPKVEFTDLSENEIIERARDLGMVPIKESIKVEKEPGESKDQEVEKTLEKLEEALERLEKSEKIQEVIETEELREDDIGEEKEVIIDSGSNLTEVATRLYEMDVIESKDEFIKLVRANNLSRKIVTGKYIIKKGSSHSEIIKLLTGANP